jgi:Raf kinase inhibitor-like YbhB/YbcL family protein
VTNARSSIPAKILAIRVPCPFPHTTGELGHKKAPATALCALDIDLSVGFATIEAMKQVSPHRNPRLAIILFATALIILWGNAAMAMTLNSPAFQQNGHIPSKYTCEGEDVSPPLAWEGVPNGAKSLVLIIDDPDAPDPKAPKMVWVHWVVYNIPPDTKSLPENASKARLPQSALLGLNDFKKTGYGGPCPPIGRHRYFHKLYALDITLDLRGATKSQIERAMRGHVLANAELIGTYQKGDR